MNNKGKKRRSIETGFDEKNVKSLSDNKKCKPDQVLSPKKKKNTDVSLINTDNEFHKLKKKNKKRKHENSEDISKPSKKLKKNKKSAEEDKKPADALIESSSKETKVQKNKKKSKKHKKMKEPTDNLATTSNEILPTQLKKNIKKDQQGKKSQENGVEEEISKIKKKKKKKSKELKKNEDLSMNTSGSPSNLSLKKLHKKKLKLLKQIEQCDKSITMANDEQPVKKNKKKKKIKKVKKSSDGSTNASPEKLKALTPPNSENGLASPSKVDLKNQTEIKSNHVKVISTKKKNKYASKNEFRKEIRQQEGQFYTLNHLSVEEMKEKIAEIRSRDEISKRALRILRTLKKKVEVAELLDKTDTSVSSDDQNQVNENIKTPKKQLFFDKPIINDGEESKSGTKNKTRKTPKKQLFFDPINDGNKIDSAAITAKKNQTPAEPLFFEDKVGDHVDDESKSEKLSLEKNKTISQETFAEDNRVDSNNSENIAKAAVSPKKLGPQSANKIDNNATNQFEKKQRYVLFVANLAYDTTTVDLKKHFLTKVSKVCDVRIPLNRETNTPRGIAFVEVENSTDFEKALSLQGTFLHNRPIRVQYTASSKKVDKGEVVHKNKKLSAMRKAGMLAGSKKITHKRSFRRNLKNQSKK